MTISGPTMMSRCRTAQTCLLALVLFAVVTAAPAPDQGTVAATPRPAYRVIALAEPGQTDKGPWAVAVNPVTNTIDVANRLSDKVTIIDSRTNSAVQR
jgi:DNA-binding beta-propeller fold protein YncE